MTPAQLQDLFLSIRSMHEAGAGGTDREIIKEWADAYYFSREDVIDVVFMMLDEMATRSEPSIVVEVTRYRCGQNERLGDAHVATGPAYVKAHSANGPLGDLCAWLAENGHAFTVNIIDQHVSMLEWSAM